jgi:hypothetical protein
VTSEILPASFRDPSGALFHQDNVLYRQVNPAYREDYEQLISSGLYQILVDKKLLIPHCEVALSLAYSDSAYKVLRPECVDYISYPYEWCFSQLKDAALATLRIQALAIEHNMTLKDASAYNIQFHQGQPVLIDTLSFVRYEEGQPWIAYRQFCQHFLAPLALMAYTDVRLNQLLRTNIDGIPLDLASRLLPTRSKLRFSILVHIHLHASSQNRYASAASEEQKKRVTSAKVSRMGLLGIVDNLKSAIEGLTWKPTKTEWGDYYEDTNYNADAMKHKKLLVEGYLSSISPAPSRIQDLGANTGTFSRIGAKFCKVISQDIDTVAVERNYLTACKNKEARLLPLLLDLTNPSPALGWAHDERMSLLQRGPSDVVMALALIHHLAISNNLPLSRIAAFFNKCCKNLIVEFIPKNDSQVVRLLASREDIFPDYTQAGFDEAFAPYFETLRSEAIKDSERFLYLMKAK